jgi:hypothetical protein
LQQLERQASHPTETAERLWFATMQGKMHDDPIAYARRDWASWLVAACVLVSFVAAY